MVTAPTVNAKKRRNEETKFRVFFSGRTRLFTVTAHGSTPKSRRFEALEEREPAGASASRLATWHPPRRASRVSESANHSRERLLAAGLSPVGLPGGTGLTCDIGSGDGPVALRADLDALPIVDGKSVDYASTVPGVCHACGHDVHTAAVLGAGLVLRDLQADGLLPGRVRLVFQPAEESSRSGALAVLDAGGVEDVSRIFALHCDPRATVGQVGLRAGAITGSADHLLVRVSGPGGHTARPHLTADLVYAMGQLVIGMPGALSRRVDPGRR
jgi:amidohydrolase